jgi:serine/threonine-protein kinase SRPK3
MTAFRRSLQAHQYFAFKIANCCNSGRESAEAEIKISDHISKFETQHPGRSYVRLIEDSFTIEGKFGHHICLVLEPMRQSLWSLPPYLATKTLPSRVFKPFLELLLRGLDFLHSDCHIIHTGKYLKMCFIRCSFTKKSKT